MYDSSAPVFANDRPRRRTILLVEDEPFVREATCCILESARFEVLPPEDAQDAMKVYEKCKRGIDLVDDGHGASGTVRRATGARSAGAIT